MSEHLKPCCGGDESETVWKKTRWWRLAIAGVAATAAEVVHWFDGAGPLTDTVLLLSATAILTIGSPTYKEVKKVWIALKNLDLNIHVLMSIAVTGAILIGKWPEAAMVVFLFALAELIEEKSLDRARHAIRGLMALAPDKATMRQPDGTWTDVDAKTVPIDAIVRVGPGERVALDGQIVVGCTTINQAPITGESLPVEKAVGDPVFAGTINETGSFEYCVTAAATQSTLSRIIHAVEKAQGARAPTQRFVDRFAHFYTPAVCAIALAMAVVPPIVFGTPWFDAVYQALVLLVIACPCALVISTPVTIVSGLAAAAREGILIKGGVYLEEGHRLRVLALDKTGTITQGKPVQTDFERLAVKDDAAMNEATVRSLAASLAAQSDHPVSKAIARAAHEIGITTIEVENFSALPGRGVKGRIAGRWVQLGNRQWVEECQGDSPALDARLDVLERQGKTVVMLIDDTEVLALFAVADTVKESSRAAIAELHALKVKTVMLTGDNLHTAQAIASQVGIDQARGNQLPADKLAAIESLLGSDHRVGMVGDGINDAPALARADIGFAMGAAGTDTAIETADVALMDDDLRKIPRFIRLSRQTSAVLKQNIALALGIKAIFIVLVLVGKGTLWMAVFADMGVSLLVVFNGLRLLRQPGNRAQKP